MNTDNFLLHIPFFTKDECEEIIEYIHKKEYFFTKNKKYDEYQNDNDIKNIGDLTKFYDEYNFFSENEKYIPRLKEVLKQRFPNLKYPIAVQSWCNIYRKNQGITWHRHNISDRFLSDSITANIFVGGKTDIGITYAIHEDGMPKYKYVNVKNKLGNIQFVKSDVFHMVKPNPYDQNRYTIGITITEFSQQLSKIISKIDAEIIKKSVLMIGDNKNINLKYE